MGNTLSYLHSFTQCIRIERQNGKERNIAHSQQLIDINHVNDGFLNDDDSE